MTEMSLIAEFAEYAERVHGLLHNARRKVPVDISDCREPICMRARGLWTRLRDLSELADTLAR